MSPSTSGSWPPFEELVVGLDDSNRYARCRAAQGLGEGRDPRAIEPLLRALRDPAGDVRAKAAVALGRFRDERALGPLIEAMGDAKVSVRSGASTAVKKFGKRAYQPLVDACRKAKGDSRVALLGVLAHHKTAEVFGLLLDAYRNASGRSRMTLLEAMGRHASPAASEFLIASLDDPDTHVQLRVLDLLARRKERRGLDRLLAALAEATATLERAVRDPAAGEEVAPGRTGEAMAAVAARLDGSIRALGEIGDERAFRPLADLLELEFVHNGMSLMMEVVRALRKIDNARAVELLHRRLDDPACPGRDRLEAALAGMDLMRASQSLAARASGGDLGTLFQGLQAIVSSQEQLRSQMDGIEEQSPARADVGRIGTDLMRRLEEVIRGLGRARPGTGGG